MIELAGVVLVVVWLSRRYTLRGARERRRRREHEANVRRIANRGRKWWQV